MVSKPLRAHAVCGSRWIDGTPRHEARVPIPLHPPPRQDVEQADASGEGVGPDHLDTQCRYANLRRLCGQVSYVASRRPGRDFLPWRPTRRHISSRAARSAGATSRPRLPARPCLGRQGGRGSRGAPQEAAQRAGGPAPRPVGAPTRRPAPGPAEAVKSARSRNPAAADQSRRNGDCPAAPARTSSG